MNELITFNEKDIQFPISSRELCVKLTNDNDHYGQWLRKFVLNEMSRQGIDYQLTLKLGSDKLRGRPSLPIYDLSLSFAKHICMLSKGKIANEIREYMIEIEKKAFHPREDSILVGSINNLIMMQQKKDELFISALESLITRIHNLNNPVEVVQTQPLLLPEKIEELQQNSENYLKFCGIKNHTSSFNYTAKLLGFYRKDQPNVLMGHYKFMEYLRNNVKWLQANNIPYQKYMHFFEVREAMKEQTSTQTGDKFFRAYQVSRMTPSGFLEIEKIMIADGFVRTSKAKKVSKRKNKIIQNKLDF